MKYTHLRKAVRVRRFFRRIDAAAAYLGDLMVAQVLYRGATGPVAIYFDGLITQSPSVNDYDGHVVVRQVGEEARYAWVGFRIENRLRMRTVDNDLIRSVVTATLQDGYNPVRVMIRGKAYDCYPLRSFKVALT